MNKLNGEKKKRCKVKITFIAKYCVKFECSTYMFSATLGATTLQLMRNAAQKRCAIVSACSV